MLFRKYRCADNRERRDHADCGFKSRQSVGEQRLPDEDTQRENDCCFQ
jgi:hypothetical protein